MLGSSGAGNASMLGRLNQNPCVTGVIGRPFVLSGLWKSIPKGSARIKLVLVLVLGEGSRADGREDPQFVCGAASNGEEPSILGKEDHPPISEDAKRRT